MLQIWFSSWFDVFCSIKWYSTHYYSTIKFSVHDAITELVMTERNEALAPLIYMIALLMAYHGPNAEILGGIGLKLWHYQTIIEDIEASIFNIGLLWMADLLSLFVTAILMWKYLCHQLNSCALKRLSLVVCPHYEWNRSIWIHDGIIDALGTGRRQT